MQITNKKFDIKDKNSLIAEYAVRPVRGVKGINENVDSVYISRNGDVLIFSLFRNKYYTYSYLPNETINKYTDKYGYVIVNVKHNDLLGNHEQHMVKLHRLVACTWIDNPNGYRDVDHVDGNKQNNCTDNLEWVTHSENCRRYWSKNIIATDRLFIECCGMNMGVVQTVNVDDYKIRYRKCKYCGKRVMTRQYVGKNETIVKEL